MVWRRRGFLVFLGEFFGECFGELFGEKQFIRNFLAPIIGECFGELFNELLDEFVGDKYVGLRKQNFVSVWNKQFEDILSCLHLAIFGIPDLSY